AAKPKASKKKKTPTKILNYYFRGGKLVKNCNMRSAARYVSSGFKKVMAGRAAADAMQDCDCAVEVRVTSKTIGFRTEDRRSVYRIAETLRKADAATPAKTSKTKAKSAPAKVAPFD
ncbi:MAG: hypothetical protein MRY74_15715, partial [Neomegalonema sp.]|nr:hypothetical protein [Neomegalonema sp.]